MNLSAGGHGAGKTAAFLAFLVANADLWLISNPTREVSFYYAGKLSGAVKCANHLRKYAKGRFTVSMLDKSPSGATIQLNPTI